MLKPKVVVLSGYGLNCEEETRYAFQLAGADGEITHINDLIDGYKKLENYQIMAIPGGFSYGDDTGSGRAFAAKLKNHLWEKIKKFVEKDRLVIGICNGFQILANLGLFGKVALLHNNSACYRVRWVDLKIENKTPWFTNIKNVSLPIAHGEGKFFAVAGVLKKLNKEKLISARYTAGEIYNYQKMPVNPNGSLENIACITDKTGRILGLMPHPERAIFFTQLPHWPYLKEKYLRLGVKLPQNGPGLKIFQNSVNYFK